MDLSQLNFADPVTLVLFVAIPVVGLSTLMIFAFALKYQRQVSASRKWSATTGRVVTSATEKRIVRSSSNRSFEAYFPKVVYEYQVDGRRYQGDRISFGEFSATNRPDPAVQKLTQYPVHSTVQVYYNPDQPEQAVLERTSRQAKTLWIVTAGMIFLIFALVGMALLLGTLLPRSV